MRRLHCVMHFVTKYVQKWPGNGPIQHGIVEGKSDSARLGNIMTKPVNRNELNCLRLKIT